MPARTRCHSSCCVARDGGAGGPGWAPLGLLALICCWLGLDLPPPPLFLCGPELRRCSVVTLECVGISKPCSSVLTHSLSTKQSRGVLGVSSLLGDPKCHHKAVIQTRAQPASPSEGHLLSQNMAQRICPYCFA